MKLPFKKNASCKVLVDRYPQGAEFPSIEVTSIYIGSKTLPFTSIKEVAYPILESLGYDREDLEEMNDGSDEKSGLMVLCGPILEFASFQAHPLYFLENAGMLEQTVTKLTKALPPLLYVSIMVEGK